MNDNNLEKKYIESDQGRIYYFSNSSNNKNASVIFFHGLSSNHTTWREMMGELSREGIASLAPDLRGHGYSNKSRKRGFYNIEIFAEDLKRIVDQENLDSFVLIGYSYSGAIALDYYLKYPDKVKGLILISANHASPLKYKGLSFLTPVFYTFFNFLGWMLIWQRRKNYYYFEQENSRSYWNSTLKGFGTMPLSINYWMLSEALKIDFSADLKNIHCPVLLIRSECDMFFNHKEMTDMAAKIPNCQTETVQANSHFLATAHQEKIKDLILNFIRNLK